jgi:hypothetical protein
MVAAATSTRAETNFMVIGRAEGRDCHATIERKVVLLRRLDLKKVGLRI